MLLQSYQSLHYIIDGANKFVSSSRPYYLNSPETRWNFRIYVRAEENKMWLIQDDTKTNRLVNKTDEFVFYLSN